MARKVFFSDCHFGDVRGVSQTSPSNNYGWFSGDRTELLTSFLGNYCMHGDVEQVVILGDLFDEWVCPAGFDPILCAGGGAPTAGEQYRTICDANEDITKALKNLADTGKLVYLGGNHDMLADESVIKGLFGDNVFCANEVSPGHYVYQKDGIWAEHGHWYGMFNGPLPSGSGLGFKGSPLPVGYFITRVLSDECLRSGEHVGLGQVVKEWLIGKGVPKFKDPATPVERSLAAAIIKDLFEDLAKNHAPGLTGVSTKWLPGMPGQALWNDIEDRYKMTYDDWPNGIGDTVGPFSAAWADAFDLDGPAKWLAEDRKDLAKIVIFGHTHTPSLGRNEYTGYPPGTIIPDEAWRIYANAGAWAFDGPYCSFVETEIVDHQHFARLKQWTKDETTGSFVDQIVRDDQWVSYP